MGNTARFEKLYDFLCLKENTGEEFALQEIADATGYALSSVKTYLTKHLLGYVVWEADHDYLSDGISQLYSKKEFLEYMSQTSRFVKMDEVDRLVESLLDRSSDAFLLALESYNRPSLQNRVEAFCIMMVNAWELLLKAQLVRNRGRDAILKADESGQTISVSTALIRVFSSERHPVRENVEALVELRNDAVHLLIPDLQAKLCEPFQASVLNFREQFEAVSERRLLDLTPGLMTLAVDRADVKPAVIERKYGKTAADRARAFLERYARRQERHRDDSRFSISISRRLVLSDQLGEGDIALSDGPGGREAVRVVEFRNVDETHPFRVKEVLPEINSRLTDPPRSVNPYDITAVDHAHKIRNGHNDKYYQYLDPPGINRYSEAYVEWFLDQLDDEWGWLEHCRDVYAQYRRSRAR